jgi:hypothetical protein
MSFHSGANKYSGLRGCDADHWRSSQSHVKILRYITIIIIIIISLYYCEQLIA